MAVAPSAPACNHCFLAKLCRQTITIKDFRSYRYVGLFYFSLLHGAIPLISDLFWFISTSITLRMTVCNIYIYIFQSKHAAINDVYKQFSTACQLMFLYISFCCRHSTCLYDCVWFYLFFSFSVSILANKRVH